MADVPPSDRSEIGSRHFGRPKLPEDQRVNEHPLYPTWKKMHERCRNPGDDSYRWYGARGIRVCDRWSGRGGFWSFVADMGDRPAGHTLDRRDNDGPYSPENCRWATPAEQRRNSRPRARMSREEQNRRARLRGRRLRRQKQRAATRALLDRVGWPLDLDTKDPEGVADFTLGLGYDKDQVVNTLVKRCNLDRLTAKRIVDDVARNH